MYKELKFFLKGKRDYVHGSDIFNEILSFYDENAVSNFKLVFYNIASKVLILTDKMPQNKNELNFICKLDKTEKNGTKTKIILYGAEKKDSKLERIPYDFESKIIELAKFNQLSKSILLEKESEFSLIEELIALHKELLTRLFNKNSWLFTRLELKKIPQKNYPLELVFRTNFDFSLLKSEIFVKDESFGFIYFSLRND